MPLRPLLGGVGMLHYPLFLMNSLNKTESAIFLYCRFFLFLRDPFFRNNYTKPACYIYFICNGGVGIASQRMFCTQRHDMTIRYYVIVIHVR